jgi:acyl-coenzyme A thioesterase PaaI-like protein
MIPVDTEKSPTMCFGCGQDNPIGLKLKFDWTDGVARAEFTPDERHQGWSNIVHGGIISSLLDEALSYPPYFTGMPCLTAKMEVRLRSTILIGEPLVVSAGISKKNRRLVETWATLELKDGTVVAEAKGVMFVIRGKGKGA